MQVSASRKTDASISFDVLRMSFNLRRMFNKINHISMLFRECMRFSRALWNFHCNDNMCNELLLKWVNIFLPYI